MATKQDWSDFLGIEVGDSPMVLVLDEQKKKDLLSIIELCEEYMHTIRCHYRGDPGFLAAVTLLHTYVRGLRLMLSCNDVASSTG